MGVVILCIGLLFGPTSFVIADDKPKPNCVLCGHITDSATGEAVTDATIYIYGGPISKVEADTNGFYCFEKISEQGNYRIGIDSNEHVGIYYYDEMPSVNLKVDSPVIKDFKLDRACMIKVQVVDEPNQPIENAEISVNSPGDEITTKRIGSDMLRRKTDKEGFYLVGGIPPKTKCLITATHGIKITSLRKDGYGVVQTQWDYAPGKLAVTLTDPQVVESSEIVLRRGVDVNGCARYEDGVPALDLKIYAYPDWWSSNQLPEAYPIDANGRFTFRHIVPGIYRIQVNIPTGESSSIGITVLQTTLPLPNNELLMITIPQKSPQALVSIKGRLNFIEDKVPNYVNIDAYSQNRESRFVTWHKYGRDACDSNFVIDRLEPGKYKLTFSSQEIERKVIEDVNAPCEDLLVELLPRGKTYLKGTVLNSEDNQPIQNFKARARKMRTLRGANYQQPDKWLEIDDAEGRFSIDTTGPGIYQVQIAAEGFAWTWSEDVNTDSNNPVVIKLSAGGSIKGKVVNNEGKPVKGAKVLLLSMAGGVKIQAAYLQDPFISEDGAVETGDDGVFELNHLAPGKESIKVIHPDYAYSVMNGIEIKEGQTTEGINVVMPAGGAVEGYVYDAQGQAQPNVTLYFQDIYSFSSDNKVGRFATVTTDANGYYRAEGLPEQLLTVKRQKAWDSMGVVCRVLAPANGRVLRIDLGGRPIVSGRIIINGVPLANRRISLSSAESPNSDVFCCYAMTGPDGKFTFGGVPNGKWKIYCEDAEKRGEWIKITAVEATGQNVDLGVVSVTLSTVRVSIEYEKESPKWDTKYATLQEGDKPWDRPIAQLTVPADEKDPYIVKNVLPGEYYLVLTRQDYAALRCPIKISENDANVIIRMPYCSSGISGRLTGGHKAAMTLWTKNKSTIAPLRPDPNFNYKLDNLPAGHYYVGGNMLIDSEELFEFDLADGEQKVLDVNVPDSPKNQSSPLLVMVLDENGSPLLGAEVRLLGGKGVIEPIVDSSQGIYFMTEQGVYTLQVNFPGYKAATQQVSIERFDPKNIQALRKPVLVRLERQ
jgi:protocatechuate 3,4-dioxygenase beta subunit